MKQTANIPAIELPLTGKALIEASAGTGKTWTLTGIILRLLIEQRRAPREIIATTFTRAAAAEMRQRVQIRLQQFRGLLIELFIANDKDRDKDKDKRLLSDDEQLGARIDDFFVRGEYGYYCQDAVNQHIIATVVAEKGLTGLLDAYRLSELALADLNQLFLGTLDSLCQKWLREFATETGASERVVINEDSDTLESIIHHRLRSDYQRYFSAQTRLENSILDAKPADYLPSIKSLLNYGRAEIKATAVPNFDEAAYAQAHSALTDLNETDMAETAAYFADFTASGLIKSRAIANNQNQLADLLRDLQREQLPKGKINSLLEGIVSALSDDHSNQFYKHGRAGQARFRQLRLMQRINAFAPLLAAREQAIVAHQAELARGIALEVRATLPKALETQGESMFSLQLQHLNRVLEGKEGIVLARYIAHRYPILLVDESQDLNHEQAKMIESIYLRPDSATDFLLLVGDPKQAIYGFRGGDVANYNRLKAQFDRKAALTVNRRSAPNLVSALNEFYLPPQGNTDSARLGDNIAYQAMQTPDAQARTIARHDGKPITTPAFWYDVAKADDDYDHIIDIIKQLTNRSSSAYYRCNALDDKQPLRHQDITVLLHSNAKLKILQQRLLSHEISSELKATGNVFQESCALEMAYVWRVMLNPYDDAMLTRLLSGALYRYSLSQLSQASGATGSDLRNHYRQYFIQAAEQWQQHSLLSALQRLLNAPDSQGQTLWQRLASYPAPDNMRYLLDCRHILQIIADHSTAKRPHQFLAWWLNQLDDPPKTEWAQLHPLPGTDAVRLMTLHSAKGLQAPVVIVGSRGNGNNPPPSVPLYRYYDPEQRLYLSFSPIPSAQAQSEQASEDERRRLLYVGMTRAEDLLFVGRRESRNAKSYEALYHADYYHSPTPNIHSASCNSQQLRQALSLDYPPQYAQQTSPPTRLKQAQPPKQTAFTGWGRSSFSALMRYHAQTDDSFAIYQADYRQHESETTDAEDADPSNTSPISIRFAFAKGPNAGSFLHETLEKLPLARQQWHTFIGKTADKYQLLPAEDSSAFVQALSQWLSDILNTPLLASGACLASLSPKQRLNELSFNLALSDKQALDLQQLVRLFAQHNIALALEDSKPLLRFIRGEIDLVYQHQGRYYVLDYKSNHLGADWADYNQQAMTATMTTHGYWLQAALYQLALHRLLQKRLPNYQADKHLGGVEYAFLRGMHPEQPDSGRLLWQLPLPLLHDLDQLLRDQS